MAYGYFKDLPRKTISSKMISDNKSNIAKSKKYDGCQRGITSIIYKSFNKSSPGGVDTFTV